MASFLVKTRVYMRYSLQGDVYVLEENVAGGGLRVLTLLLALTTSIIATTMHTPTVRADEGDTLYCINNSDVKIRPYAGTGTVTEIARLALSSTGSVTGSSFNLFDLVGAKIDNQWTIVDPNTCKPVKITKLSGIIGGAYNDNYPVNIKATALDVSTRNPHSGIGIGDNGSMVDSDGRLWFSTDSAAKDPLDQHYSETYRFSHIAGYNNDTKILSSGDRTRIESVTFDNGLTVDYSTTSEELEKKIETSLSGTVLLGHRIKDQSTVTPTSVVQMPTTGAPDGLSTVGLIAVGIGMAGVTLMLSRRRD